METLGIYVQVPYCASKCSFCNFSSRVAPTRVFDGYCRALEQEIECLPACYDSEGIGRALPTLPVDTVYVGGGTPSILGAERLQEIFQGLGRRFELAPSIEFALEVTPGSADDEFLKRARALGVNRLSIGAQSFNDRELCSVGRLHSSAETDDLVCRARRVGFEIISLDLIAGLPYQTESSWLWTLRRALRLQPEHVSVYLFEIDEKSRLGREVLRQGSRCHATAVPGDDFMADAYEKAGEELISHGYVQYEISNFALPGFESLHNQKYWQLKPYVGLGAGAHSFDGNCRWANEPETELYERRLACGESPIVEIRRLSTEEQVEEFLFLGLRQRAGIDLTIAGRRWGRATLSRFEQRISALSRDGWLERQGEHVALSARALLVSNEIFQEFLTV